MRKYLNNRRSYIIVIFLFAITIGAFSQVFTYPFIPYDDDEYVYENSFIQSGLTLEGLAWAFSTLYAATWQPTTWLSHMVDVQLFGLNAGGHHLINVLLHATNTILLFVVLSRMTGVLWQSCFVAVLFAIHPLHVESVAWVAERKDVLSIFFFMLTLLAYVRYVEKPKLGRYIFLVVFFIFGLMSKPMLVTLPFILLLLDYWPLRRIKLSGGRLHVSQQESQQISMRRLLSEKVPLFILSGASCVITYISQSEGGAVGSLSVFPFWGRAANAIVSIARYLGKMIWPASLSVIYPYDITSLPYWKILGAILLISCLTLLAMGMAKRRPYAAVGWLWYLGTLFPVIGLVQIGQHAMADRYTYLPLIGIFIILAWGLHDLGSRWRIRRYWVIASMTLLLSSLFLTTWFQVKHWRNGVALFRHSLEVTSNNAVANNNLGKAFLDERRFEEAIPFFKEALRIEPDLYHAYFGIAHALIQQGRIEEAIDAYRHAFEIVPYGRFRLTNVGVDLAQQGKMVEAISIFREAIRMDPNDGYANYNLAYALLLQGKTDEAMPFVKEAIRLNPNDRQMMRKLNSALMMKKK